MIEDLMKNNKLEYVNIEHNINDEFPSETKLSTNILNLEYFELNTVSRKFVVLDISQEYPEKLKLYCVNNMKAIENYGKIIGP